MIGVAILGSTGSIGTQTLDVIRQFPDRLRVVGLAAGSNGQLLREQAGAFGVSNLALLRSDRSVPSGIEALEAIATLPEADVVVVSVAGVIGLRPTLAAIHAGKQIALASKEVLVAAGELVMPLARSHGTTIRPIDSEHSAIFQCLQGAPPGALDSIVLTASGGPFHGWSRDRLRGVTVEQTLNHPTWRMGGKITVDSATMMNKGLETLEARWLFDLPTDKVEVVVHRQSIVHSLVRFRDQSVLGQMGWPDMRLPIAYALLYPERPANEIRRWDPVATPNLTFERADSSVFRCLSLAREADRTGGTMPCAMNAANEEAAAAYLEGGLGFLDIEGIVEDTMAAHRTEPATLDLIFEADAQARSHARQVVKRLRR